MIEQLLTHLGQAGLELTDEEVADSIWLAMQMTRFAASSGSSLSETVDDHSDSIDPSIINKDKKDVPPNLTQNPSSSPEVNPTPKVDINLPDNSLNRSDNNSEAQSKKKASNQGLPFRAPATSALQNGLALGRALRSLMRKVQSPTRQVLDEEGTVSQIADQDVWVPILKPDQERWLDLELIIEKSYSSFIWQDSVDEFQQLLKCQGAFRNVRVWYLESSEIGDPLLLPAGQEKKADLRTRKHRELLHADKRGLILLVSDCTSVLWRQARIHRWLQDWSRHQPTALIQLLPERLWGSSELGLGSKVELQGLTAGLANPKLILDSLAIWERESIDWEQGLLLPVVTMEVQPLKQWARMVSGVGSVRVPGILFDLVFVERQVTQKRDSQTILLDIEPEKLVDRFLLTASPLAQQLAGMMAAVPVSLPVVHLIRQKLLPGSTSVNVAEVFLSGMIRRISPEHETAQYNFVGNARKLLNVAMLWDKTQTVLDTISEYIAEKLGKSIKSFDALLMERQDWTEAEQAEILPFAQMTLEVLRNLGGDFAAFADELEQQRQSKNNSATLQDESEFSGIPPLEDFSFEVPTIIFEEEDEWPPMEMQTVEVATISLETTDDVSFDVSLLEPFTFQIATLTQSNGQWEVSYRSGEAQRFIEPLGISNALELEMIRIPAGEFMMGSPENEHQRFDHESPQHQVEISEFFMGRYPVTQAQWRAVAAMPQVKIVLKADPSRFNGDNRPVERIHWHEAVEFCQRLSKKTGINYRLPSEAEWEYGCRAGTKTPFHFGETITTELANYNGKKRYGKGPKGEYRGETTLLGQFEVANNLGLCDLYGNVLEWCADPWHDNYEGAPVDGSVWKEGGDDSKKILRGGSWRSDARNCRSAYRGYPAPDDQSGLVGFRVVCAVRGSV